jgi:lipid-A-disaccharide synthase
MLGAARLIRDRRPGAQFVIPRARTLPPGLVEDLVRREGPSETLVHEGDYPEILGACTAGIVASGTATLDAALAGMPIVVVYRVRPVTYLLLRLLVSVEHVALPNLIAGRRVVPELVQADCAPERIAGELLGYLVSPARRDRVRKGLAEVRERLGEPGAYDRAAAAVLSEIGAESA